MPAMATSLTEFADNGNSRTYTVSGHTALKPRLVIQKRKIPATAEASAEVQVNVVYGTVDAANVILASKVAFEMAVRYPVNGTAADTTAALVVIRDIIASDEFTTAVNTQNWLKP